MKRLLILVVCGLLAGCGGGTSISARVISTLGTVGPGEQRVLVEVRNGDGELLALDSPPHATLRDENGSPMGVYPGELVWQIPGGQPAYAFLMDIPFAGTLQLTVDAGGLGETPPAGFLTVADPVHAGVGESAPPVEGEALSGPVLVVFASPAWCPTESCELMVDQVESAARNSGVDWEQVEVFANPQVESSSDLEFSPEVAAWGIPSQPWLYVVDATGTVAAVYEGAIADGELQDAIALISG